MCLSPDEMTAAQLQDEIDWMIDYVKEVNGSPFYEARIEQMEKLVKELAEEGAMLPPDTDHV